MQMSINMNPNQEDCMFIDLMDMIISERTKYSCENISREDLSCRACNVTPSKSNGNENSSISGDVFEDDGHTPKSVSPLVGEMFGYLHS